MHAKFFALAAFVASVVALPQNGGSCGAGGQLQCCNSIQSADHKHVKEVAEKEGLLSVLDGVLKDGANVNAGLTCDPISALGVGGNSCSQQTACCTGNNFSGLLVLGCSPININL